jgi:hypothetical protein
MPPLRKALVSCQGEHGTLTFLVVKVVVEVQHLRGAMPQPGEGLPVGDPVVGAEAGEGMAEGMELVLAGILEAANFLDSHITYPF